MNYSPVPAEGVSSVMTDLAAASAIVQRTDDEIAGLQVVISTLRLRTEPLHQQINDLQGAPTALDGPDEDQVQALIADPSKQVDLGAITQMVHSARAEADATAMAVATVQTAIGRIDTDIVEIEGKIAALRARRDDEYRIFAGMVQSKLGALFKSEFVRLCNEVMLPLLAVTKLRTSDGSTDLLSVRNPGAVRIGARSLVEFETWQAWSSQWDTVKLFEARGMAPREAEQVVQAFRNLLQANHLASTQQA